MSVQYILDGYNLIRHNLLQAHLKGSDQKLALVHLIRRLRLCGSEKNKVRVVFDGFPLQKDSPCHDAQCEFLYAQDESADARIKRMVESAGQPRNVIVVSDDNELRFSVRLAGARTLKVEEFLGGPAATSRGRARAARPRNGAAGRQPAKAELDSRQARLINDELRRLWLGEP